MIAGGAECLQLPQPGYNAGTVELTLVGQPRNLSGIRNGWSRSRGA